MLHWPCELQGNCLSNFMVFDAQKNKHGSPKMRRITTTFVQYKLPADPPTGRPTTCPVTHLPQRGMLRHHKICRARAAVVVQAPVVVPLASPCQTLGRGGVYPRKLAGKPNPISWKNRCFPVKMFP